MTPTVAIPELFPAPGGAKPITDTWASAAQLAGLLPFAKITDAFLRRLCNPNNPNPRTGAAWIPKPRGGRYELRGTVLGLLEWYCARANDSNTLPRQCASMRHASETYGLPVEMFRYARAHGCASAFDSANRIRDMVEIFNYFAPLLKKIFSGGAVQLEGFKEFDFLDKNREEVLMKREARKKLERQNSEYEAQVRERVDQFFWENLLSPLRSQLVNQPKILKREIARLFPIGQKTDAATLKAANRAIMDAIQQTLAQLTRSIPARK